MDVTRRGFLSALLGGLTLDPERALWVPGRKLISIPKPRPLLVGEIMNQSFVNLGLMSGSKVALSSADRAYALKALNQMFDRWNAPRHYDLARELMPRYPCR